MDGITNFQSWLTSYHQLTREAAFTGQLLTSRSIAGILRIQNQYLQHTATVSFVALADQLVLQTYLGFPSPPLK